MKSFLGHRVLFFKHLVSLSLLLGAVSNIYGIDSLGKSTTFLYGGYIKFDALYTNYANGIPSKSSAINDFIVPGGIPVGAYDRSSTYDFHVKESRFDFDVLTDLKGKKSTWLFRTRFFTF